MQQQQQQRQIEQKHSTLPRTAGQPHLGQNSQLSLNSGALNPFPESRNFRTIREIAPRAFKFYMEQRVDNLLRAANERFERKKRLEIEMQNAQMTERERSGMRQLLRKKETNHLRLIRAKLSKGQFHIIKVLGKVQPL